MVSRMPPVMLSTCHVCSSITWCPPISTCIVSHVSLLQEYNDGRLVRQQVLSASDIAAISSALGAPVDGSGSGAAAAGGGADGRTSSSQHVTPLGEVLYKEHSAYDLMVQLQLGIR